MIRYQSIRRKFARGVRLPDEKRTLRTTDFMLDEEELKVYLEDGRLVLVVPKEARYKLFQEAHSDPFADH